MSVAAADGGHNANLGFFITQDGDFTARIAQIQQQPQMAIFCPVQHGLTLQIGVCHITVPQNRFRLHPDKNERVIVPPAHLAAAEHQRSRDDVNRSAGTPNEIAGSLPTRINAR